jgi:polyphosphate kinase
MLVKACKELEKAHQAIVGLGTMAGRPRSADTKKAARAQEDFSPSFHVDAFAQISSIDDPRLYFNRELSLLSFQNRVLEEAEDESNPLLERFKFLSIVGSNMEEFFMVRVAGLKHQLEAGTVMAGPDGLSPNNQLMAIRGEASELFNRAYRCLNLVLLPALKQANIDIVKYEDLAVEVRSQLQQYFLQNIFPVLTPLAFDPGHPFPHISNLSLNLAVLIRDTKGEERFARVKVPDSLTQLIPLERVMARSGRAESAKNHSFIWLDDLIASNLEALFPGMTVVESHPFQVTRDAEVEIQEWEAEDLLETTEEGIRQRRFGEVVRLIVDLAMPEHILDILINNLEISSDDVYRVEGRLPLSSVKHIYAIDRPDLKDTPFLPAVPAALNPDTQEEDTFAAMRRRDILLHHPYDSFQPVVNFLNLAARDPQVLAIKMTLYRVGNKSPVVEALLEAMENGKQVAVLVELKARFDEESNIEWAKALERYGVHVVYGLIGLKIHSKVALVVRREGEAIRRYVHLSTGNYNPLTAHLYTDLGLFTCDEEIGSDVTDLFNYLTGYSAKRDYRKLLVAPINLKDKLEWLIRREIDHQKNGRGGHLIFKMNALVDEWCIRLLYEASQAGVKINLLVRGICCLRPGIPGISENITVTSIVGRFLEHSRIFWFRNGGDEQMYLGSADMMPRNLYRRVEVLFPVEDQKLLRYLRDEVLEKYMADCLKARFMQPDGAYVRTGHEHTDECLSAQLNFLGHKPPWER